VGEFMTLFGAWQMAPWLAVVAALGLVLGPVYLLRAFNGAVYAAARQNPPAGHPPASYLAPERLPDLTWSEAWVMVPMIGIMFLIGIFPVILTHAMTTLGLALHFPWGS
jgi:NADH-quinone oxidoreductase subunit M